MLVIISYIKNNYIYKCFINTTINLYYQIYFKNHSAGPAPSSSFSQKLSSEGSNILLELSKVLAKVLKLSTPLNNCLKYI